MWSDADLLAMFIKGVTALPESPGREAILVAQHRPGFYLRSHRTCVKLGCPFPHEILGEVTIPADTHQAWRETYAPRTPTLRVKYRVMQCAAFYYGVDAPEGLAARHLTALQYVSEDLLADADAFSAILAASAIDTVGYSLGLTDDSARDCRPVGPERYRHYIAQAIAALSPEARAALSTPVLASTFADKVSYPEAEHSLALMHYRCAWRRPRKAATP